MGSLFSTPKMPQKSQEQIDAERQAKLQAERDKRDAEDRAANEERKRKSNLLGARSLQSEDVEGFTGYRRKVMGAGPSQGKSIRY